MALAIRGFAIHDFGYSHWNILEPNPYLYSIHRLAIHGFAIHIHKNLERNPFWIARETCILFSYRRKEAKR